MLNIVYNGLFGISKIENLVNHVKDTILDESYGVSLAYSSAYTIYLPYIKVCNFYLFCHARIQFGKILD